MGTDTCIDLRSDVRMVMCRGMCTGRQLQHPEPHERRLGSHASHMCIETGIDMRIDMRRDARRTCLNTVGTVSILVSGATKMCRSVNDRSARDAMSIRM